MRRIFLHLMIRFMQNDLCREYTRLEDIREAIMHDEARLEAYARELMTLEIYK